MPRPERPLEDGDDAVVQFAAELRLLREKAGSPTYRELARQTNYSAGTLSDAAGGRKLPTLAVALAYVKACAGDEAEWEARWHAVSEGTRAPEPEAEPPYVGLTAFGTDDAERFFGRKRVVEKVLERLATHRFLAVLGASGSGKSSVLRAGVIPALETSGTTALITPGAHPMAELGKAGPVDVLVVDQFEEVFTLCQDPAERAEFIAALVQAKRVVLGARIDFHARFAQYPELTDALEDGQILLGPMTTEELRLAITQPAVRVGLRVETALVSRLIADATGQPGMLPLLSHALLETWHRRRGNALILSGYESTGGIERAVAQTSEHVFTTLSPAQQQLTRQIFLRLTALGEGTEDTKRRLSRDELDDDPDIDIALGKLADARLITLDEHGIDIAHEALIRSWPRLREWLTEDREALRVHRRITEAAEAWEALDHDAGSLYRGARLAIAQDWATTHEEVLSKKERQFLDDSSAAETAERAATRKRTRRLRQLVALMAVLLLVAVGASVFAVSTSQTATDERNTARSQNVSHEATSLRPTKPAVAAQLSLAAYRLVPTMEARGSLLSTFSTPYSSLLLGHTNNVNTVAFSPDGKLLATGAWDRTVRLWDVTDTHHPIELPTLNAHGDNVLAVAFSPDGKTLATASWDKTAKLWDVTDPRRITPIATLTGHTDQVLTLAFSRDGKTLATGSGDKTVRLWNLADRTSKVLAGHTKGVVTVGFSPDGTTLATGSDDKTMRLWDAAGTELKSISAAPALIRALAFSPTGHTLAGGEYGGENNVRLWDVTAPAAPKDLAAMTGHKAGVRALAFTSDGSRLLSSAEDRTAKVWNVTDLAKPRSVLTLTGHTDNVAGATFSPDGRTVATTSDDYTARLWDIPGPVVASTEDDICRVTLTPDGHTLITSGRDGKVRVVDPAVPRELTTLTDHTNGACAAAVSPDGNTLYTGSWDGTVKRRSLTDPTKPVVIAQHKDEIDALALSPDGKRLAVAGDKHTVRLLDSASGQELAVLTGHADDVHALAFSPDGRVLASTSWDYTVRLWDMTANGALLGILQGHTKAVTSLAYSPDGKTIVTAGRDRTARLWDVRDPRAPREISQLSGHTDALREMVFSSDGHTLATSSHDRTVRLWDTTNPAAPRQVAVLTGHTDRVLGLAFAPDGHTLFSSGSDDIVLRWETDPELVARRVCEVAAPRITEAEWDRYFPGVAYQPPCS
ncbi:helix-turn-helix domain-containing protein [Amycolatopsis sp. NPDC059657]|uniref:nSTAND1 domain-containing NTPase n=1 Tax=Amycolatopsis sp. NPDC059657 TaxID=3346899 RepID=UPI00366A7F08